MAWKRYVVMLLAVRPFGTLPLDQFYNFSDNYTQRLKSLYLIIFPISIADKTFLFYSRLVSGIPCCFNIAYCFTHAQGEGCVTWFSCLRAAPDPPFVGVFSPQDPLISFLRPHRSDFSRCSRVNEPKHSIFEEPTATYPPRKHFLDIDHRKRRADVLQLFLLWNQ